MIVILKNQTGATLSYVSGAVSVNPSSNLTVTLDYWTLLFQDSTLISDFQNGNVVINDGTSDYNSSDGLPFTSEFFHYTFTPSANTPLYYSVPVNIRQSAATAANGTVWTMRNPANSTKVIFIEFINFLMGFDAGTPLGRSLQRYDLVRFTSATPSGGTAITVIAADSAASASAVTDVRFADTGLTTAGVTFGAAFCTISVPASDGATNYYKRDNVAFRLAAGEGLAIRLTVAAVVGQDLTGEIIWSER